MQPQPAGVPTWLCQAVAGEEAALAAWADPCLREAAAAEGAAWPVISLREEGAAAEGQGPSQVPSVAAVGPRVGPQLVLRQQVAPAVAAVLVSL